MDERPYFVTDVTLMAPHPEPLSWERFCNTVRDAIDKAYAPPDPGLGDPPPFLIVDWEGEVSSIFWLEASENYRRNWLTELVPATLGPIQASSAALIMVMALPGTLVNPRAEGTTEAVVLNLISRTEGRRRERAIAAAIHRDPETGASIDSFQLGPELPQGVSGPLWEGLEASGGSSE